MKNLIVLGTDTDAGKTTFSAMWLSVFADRWAYWKPLETGTPDSESIRTLVPRAKVFPSLAHFEEAVAPALAARRAGRSIPGAADIVLAQPISTLPCLIETFGGPMSPLSDDELQLELIRQLDAPAVICTSSSVGAIGRGLATLNVVRGAGIVVRAIVLIGRVDDYAVEQIVRHGQVEVVSLQPPQEWSANGFTNAAQAQVDSLHRLEQLLHDSHRRHHSDWAQRDATSLWHPYTPLQGADTPVPVVGAESELLHLDDGRTLIDGVSSWWTILHGHRDPRLMASLRSASERIDHVLFAGATHPAAIELAEQLLLTTPWSGGKVFLSDNGSTAIEVALKMAYQYWCLRGESKRSIFIGFEGAYHGDTFGAMAVSRDRTFFNRFEPLLFRAEQVPVSPRALDEALSRNTGHVAAVIIEPVIQAAGGMRTHSPETLKELETVARRHGTLFIVDEVMTGMRTGAIWAHSHAGVRPDLICAAKTLAGGVMPIAATLASPEIVEPFDSSDRARTFFHGHSFTAHPLACAVACENFRMLKESRWRDDSDRISRYWMQLTPRLASQPGVHEVRTSGTMIAVELETSGGYLAAVGAAMRRTAIENGVLLRPLGSVLYSLPPLCTSDQSLERIASAMEAAIRAARE